MSSRGKAGTPVGPQGSPTGAGSRERRATEAPEKGAADAGGRGTRAADAGGRGTRAADTAPPRPRTKAAQREATTAALIDAARELFAGRGYANVGTEEIVQQAGVTRGALYHHFRSGKEELFRAVVVQISAETAGRVRAAAQANDDPWNALVEGIDAFLDACALPEVQRILLVDGPAVLGWDVWRAIDSDYGLGLLEGALQRAIDAGRLPPQPARPAAHVLLGALDEAAMVVARADDPRAARREMGQTVHRLLEGLRVPVR
jgi:AcrR family transcriptional regulator